jgi:hypothetical protein
MTVRTTGSTPDPAPNEAEKGRATNQHCDTAAAGSESEGVRRLEVETRRTQRTRRSAEAAVIAPVRRLCGRAMLAGTCHSERFSNPRPVRSDCVFTGNHRSKADDRRAATPPSPPAPNLQGPCHHTARTKAPARPKAKNTPPPQKIRAPLRDVPSHALKEVARERLTGFRPTGCRKERSRGRRAPFAALRRSSGTLLILPRLPDGYKPEESRYPTSVS